MGHEEAYNIGLCLGLGHQYDHQQQINNNNPKKKTVLLPFDHLSPSLALGPPTSQSAGKMDFACNKVYGGEFTDAQYGQTSSLSAVSSYSNSSVKREKEYFGSEEIEKVSPTANDQEDEEASARKKLRLTKEQSVVLEESFKEHTTLNPKQKQALARKLNLRPRQVEVWFQNRRARTKLKQTEVDCELLKKCCETLTDENKRLQKEVQELKALKLATPFYVQLPAAATLTMCPSCVRIAGISDNNSSKGPFTIEPKPQLYSSFTNPSAAC